MLFLPLRAHPSSHFSHYRHTYPALDSKRRRATHRFDRANFPGQVQWVQMRLDDLNKFADMFEGKQGVVEQFGDPYKKRASKLSAITEANAELNARQQSLLKAQEKRLLKLTTDSTRRLREISQTVLDTSKVIFELKCKVISAWRGARLEN